MNQHAKYGLLLALAAYGFGLYLSRLNGRMDWLWPLHRLGIGTQEILPAVAPLNTADRPPETPNPATPAVRPVPVPAAQADLTAKDTPGAKR